MNLLVVEIFLEEPPVVVVVVVVSVAVAKTAVEH